MQPRAAWQGPLHDILRENCFALSATLTFTDAVHSFSFFIQEAVLRNVSRGLQPQGQDFLRSLLLGPLQSTAVTLQPTDDEFVELLRFLHAYRDFWNIIGLETVPKVKGLV